MEESRRLGGASTRILLLSITLFFPVGWADSDVTPEPVMKKTTYNRKHPDGGERWKGKTDWLPRGDSCYRYMTNMIAWGDAEVFCQSLAPGSHLASAHSKEDIDYLKGFAYWHTRFHRSFWLGASDLYKKRRFLWTDGSPMDFKNWHPEEPFSSGGKEHCIISNYKGPGLWGDVKCESNLAFVCKAPNPPEGKPLCSREVR
ncbi:lectin-like [Lissotriton helveticus]